MYSRLPIANYSDIYNTWSVFVQFINFSFPSWPFKMFSLFYTGEAGKMADPSSMLSICDPVHLVLIKTDVTGETTLQNFCHTVNV